MQQGIMGCGRQERLWRTPVKLSLPGWKAASANQDAAEMRGWKTWFGVPSRPADMVNVVSWGGGGKLRGSVLSASAAPSAASLQTLPDCSTGSSTKAFSKLETSSCPAVPEIPGDNQPRKRCVTAASCLSFRMNNQKQKIRFTVQPLPDGGSQEETRR